MSQKNSSFNFKKIPDLKKRKPVQDSDEAMPKLSAKDSADIDQEDTESIIVTKQQLKKFENKKSSILKRGSNNNLVSRESEISIKPLNDLPDGILNFDSENEQYTLEGDIEGLMSVSEPSTRVHTTHPSQHPTDPEEEESEDEAVIEDFSNKKDHLESDTEARVPDTNESVDTTKDETLKEDSHGNLLERQNDDSADNDEPEDRDNSTDSRSHSSPSTESDKRDEIEPADEEVNVTARDISDEESEEESGERDEIGPENNEELQIYDKDSPEEHNTESKTDQGDVDKNPVLEDDLHVSDAEDETQDLSHSASVHSIKDKSEEGEVESKATNDEPESQSQSEGVAILLQNFDSTIDKIVADVTTKSVINKERDQETKDFSAFNWKPNVDFFNFGNSENAQTSVRIFNFGKGTPPPPQIIKKKGVLSGDRPRSKSLQRALAKRNGYN